MDGRPPLLEAVRRDARGVAAAKRKTWTLRALIAAFVCALMYVHYRTMHALAAFSTQAFSDAEKQGARAVDDRGARAGATRGGLYGDQAGGGYDTNAEADTDADGKDVPDDTETSPDAPGVPDPPGVPGVPPVGSEKRAPDATGEACVDAAGGSCLKWVKDGECKTNPEFLLKNCRKSCGGCGGGDSDGRDTTRKRAPRMVGDDDGDNNENFVILNTGTRMPRVGFGTAGLGPGTTQAVLWALQAGYRAIDSAQAREWYREDLVGVAIAESGIPRSELFLTSKLHPKNLGYNATLRAFQNSLDDLNTEYLDLFMLHYPKCFGTLCVTEPEGTWGDSWRALEDLFGAGKVKAIGVSNFDLGELRELAKTAKIEPAVVQRNSDIFAQDLTTNVFVTSKGWQYQAYSSLGSQWLMKGHNTNPVLSSPAVIAIAERRGVSPAVVCLKWALQKGQIVIPRSSNEQRIRENLRVLEMNRMTESEMDELDKLDGHPPFVEF
jgi:diketogulonate reductase-like aldo/keto reductase|tara:strand:- start:92 stop:1573 length:1482 start_codon:yes stop_codon:yes gene_type:complete